MKQGRFIVLDGSEGAGKSTQIKRVKEWLEQQGIDCWQTREPGGTATGERIREILLDPQSHIDSDTELLLIMAARKQHLSEQILPRLTKGQWVVCDRFNDATYAYQGYGRHISLTRIAELEAWAMPDIEPDLRLILRVSPEVARERLTNRGNIQDRFEKEQQDFFTAVAEGYATRAQAANACSIDADSDADATFEQIRQKLVTLL